MDRRPEDALTLTGTHVLSVRVCLGAHLCVCLYTRPHCPRQPSACVAPTQSCTSKGS